MDGDEGWSSERPLGAPACCAIRRCVHPSAGGQWQQRATSMRPTSSVVAPQ